MGRTIPCMRTRARSPRALPSSDFECSQGSSGPAARTGWGLPAWRAQRGAGEIVAEFGQLLLIFQFSRLAPRTASFFQAFVQGRVYNFSADGKLVGTLYRQIEVRLW